MNISEHVHEMAEVAKVMSKYMEISDGYIDYGFQVLNTKSKCYSNMRWNFYTLKTDYQYFNDYLDLIQYVNELIGKCKAEKEDAND